jgi:antitoxin component of MazEF toxin-antitoxin module
MPHKKISASESPGTLLLPQEMLDEMGIADGDEVDVSIIERSLVVTPLDEVERARKLGSAITSVFARRRRAYQELAKGAE